MRTVTFLVGVVHKSSLDRDEHIEWISTELVAQGGDRLLESEFPREHPGASKSAFKNDLLLKPLGVTQSASGFTYLIPAT